MIAPYQVIYADPPWSFEVWSKATGHGRSAESHYATMAFEALKALPVESIAAPNCALFLWCCRPSIPEALEVIESWGFTYKTEAFTWIKRTSKNNLLHWGMGYWTRANTEPCLLATRGNPRRVDAGVHQVIEAPVGRHSTKPPEARDRIVRLMGDIPRIELFARPPVPAGWDAAGNEIDGLDMSDALRTIANRMGGQRSLFEKAA